MIWPFGGKCPKCTFDGTISFTIDKYKGKTWTFWSFLQTAPIHEGLSGEEAVLVAVYFNSTPEIGLCIKSVGIPLQPPTLILLFLSPKWLQVN
jgi:hypothetical protein